MRGIIKLSKIKIPDSVHIPEGYEIKLSTGSPRERAIWDYLIKHFRSHPYPENEGDRVWFCYHGDEPVGLNTVIIPKNQKNICHMSVSMVLPEHRRKGLHTAMTYYRLKYVESTGNEYIRIASRNFLDDWWRKYMVDEA